MRFIAFVVGVFVLLEPHGEVHAQKSLVDFKPCALSLDRMLRAIHISGNWGANPEAVAAWEEDRSTPLVPLSHMEWLHDIRVKRRTHSLFRQGLMLYHHLPNWPDDRIRPLMKTFGNMLLEQRVYREVFGVI